MFNVDNVTINGVEAYLKDGYLHTVLRSDAIRVKNKFTLKNVSIIIGTSVKLELDNVTMTDTSIDLYPRMSFTRPIEAPTIIRDTVMFRSECIYNDTRTFGEHDVLIDKSNCTEMKVVDTRLVNSKISNSTITSLPNSYILNTVTVLNSEIEINQDLIEKFIVGMHQSKESYEILHNTSSGGLWYVYKKYTDNGAYFIRKLDADGVFTSETLVVKRPGVDKLLREGWILVRGIMNLTYDGISGIHSGKRVVKKA
jgi:hypothetical protein